METLHLFRRLVKNNGENAFTKSAAKPRRSGRGWIGVGRAGLNAQAPTKTHAVPEPRMGEGTAEVEAPAFMPGRTSTEALAATLKGSPCFRQAFLGKLELCADRVQIETQPPHYSVAGRPDFQISSLQYLVLCEVKWDDWLSLEQWNRYKAILTKDAGTREKHLLAIVKDPRGVDGKILDCDPEAKIWLWAEVLGLAQQAAPGQSDPVACFLVSELTDLLGEHLMRPFTQFSQDDFAVLHGLCGVRESMEAFFRAVLDKLGSILQGGVQRAIVKSCVCRAHAAS